MASPEAQQLLRAHSHRLPLGRDQIRALSNALVALKNALGPENAIETSVYTAILRLLKAHVTPLPNSSVTFAQVQAARLQALADKLIADKREHPPELAAAISQGLVAGFDPRTRLQIPPGTQREQLLAQQENDRNEILHEKARLREMHNDFQLARAGALRHAHAQADMQRETEQVVPWAERRLAAIPPKLDVSDFKPIDLQTLASERNRSLVHRVTHVRSQITAILTDHERGRIQLSPREAALLESRLRHTDLLNLQSKMRHTIWNENHVTERDGRRGSKGKVRTLKQLQREFERVERARLRQIDSEEKDVRRKKQAWMNAMVDHLNKFRGYHRDVVRRGVRAVTKAVLKHHEEVARNASRAEREAEKARIQKLKDDDEEGYLELVRKTKNTRLLELLDQTDKYLQELGAVVKEERVKSGVVEYENHGGETTRTRQDYYETAHAIKEEVTSQSSLLVGGTLKEYQLQGIQWMVSLYNNRLNGILADEMGLGKTIQTLGLVAHLMERKDNPGPYLIIVPLSTISNWELEFARWAPAIRVVVFKGDAKTRKKLYEDVIEKKSFNVCLVTYEYVVRGKNFLKRIQWQHLIIDEGHRIKNHESRLSAVLHAYYRSRNRLLLTGTPLQNSLTELWALLNFLLPNVFKSAESFESWFAAPFAQMGVGNITTTEHQAQLTEEESLLIIRRLHQVLRPFLLRRLKSDVLRMGEQLPEKQEHIVLCEMSGWQRYMYLKIVKSDMLLFTDRHGRQRYDKLSNPAVQLRKCVNHPYLFFQDHASRIVDSPALWRASGKFDMLDSIIMKLLRTDHRILIFNQMTKVVDLQERLLRYRNIPFYRLDGSTSTDDRKKMVNNFNGEDADVHVFLLTTRAGGLGVNLQTADSVIIFDSDWNPSMDQQAQDRAHRIGQRREVLVLRMITAKSIEEDVMERASFKRGLEKKIIRAGMFDEQSKDSERQAMLRELLRVEGPGSDDENDDGLPTEEDINRILARSEDEFDIFTTIDEERRSEVAMRPRLFTEKEIPEWAVKVPKKLLQKAKTSGAGNWSSMADNFDLSNASDRKKRRAATTNVSYGLDQLSECQYLRLMERSEAGEDLTFSDAVKAVSGRKRKRRKKHRDGELKEEEAFHESGNDNDGVLRNDEIDSEQVMPSQGDKAGAIKSAVVATKTLNASVENFDDDITEGGNVTGGEHSVAPSAGDDMIIEDEDDGEETGREDQGHKELDDGRSADLGGSADEPRVRSDDEMDSESSDESGAQKGVGHQGAATGKTTSRDWTNMNEKRMLEFDKVSPRRRRSSHRGSGQRNVRTGRKARGGDESETSGESGSGEQIGGATASTRGEKMRSMDIGSDGDDDVDTYTRPRAKRSKRSDRGGKGAVSGNSNMGDGINTMDGHSDPSENGEVAELNISDDAEDGEIREDGELSDENIGNIVVKRSQPMPKLSSIAAPKRRPSAHIGRKVGAFPNKGEAAPAKTGLPERVSTINAILNSDSGGAVEKVEKKMNRSSGALIAQDDDGEDGEIEEDGEIVE